MFNNVVLDVFIGLIFVFLLYSLLATIIQEIIARWLALRARMLIKALKRMLEDNAGNITETGISNAGAEVTAQFKGFFKPIDQNTLLQKFYNQPTVKYLGEDKVFGKPAYLHAHNFSQTIVQLLRGETYDGRTSNESELIWKAIEENTLGINEETLKNFKNLFVDARQDVFLFKNKLEDWFEETMERASGWYKKQIQTCLIIIGFVLAVAFNIDSIAIAKILMKDKNVREQLVQLAVSRQQSYGIINDSIKPIRITRTEIANGDTTITSFDSIPKRTDAYLEATYRDLSKDATDVMGILGLRGKDKVASQYQSNWFLVFLGWILTALAISLGAPFWFDMLNKFVKLRTSGPKPANIALQDKPGQVATASNQVKGKDGKEITG